MARPVSAPPQAGIGRSGVEVRLVAEVGEGEHPPRGGHRGERALPDLVALGAAAHVVFAGQRAQGRLLPRAVARRAPRGRPRAPSAPAGGPGCPRGAASTSRRALPGLPRAEMPLLRSAISSSTRRMSSSRWRRARRERVQRRLPGGQGRTRAAGGRRLARAGADPRLRRWPPRRAGAGARPASPRSPRRTREHRSRPLSSRRGRRSARAARRASGLCPAAAAPADFLQPGPPPGFVRRPAARAWMRASSFAHLVGEGVAARLQVARGQHGQGLGEEEAPAEAARPGPAGPPYSRACSSGYSSRRSLRRFSRTQGSRWATVFLTTASPHVKTLRVAGEGRDGAVLLARRARPRARARRPAGRDGSPGSRRRR